MNNCSGFECPSYTGRCEVLAQSERLYVSDRSRTSHAFGIETPFSLGLFVSFVNRAEDLIDKGCPASEIVERPIVQKGIELARNRPDYYNLPESDQVE